MTKGIPGRLTKGSRGMRSRTRVRQSPGSLPRWSSLNSRKSAIWEKARHIAESPSITANISSGAALHPFHGGCRAPVLPKWTFITRPAPNRRALCCLKEKQMKYGVIAHCTEYTMRVDALARAVEERGFESLFVPEHTHIPVERRTPFPMGGELPKEYYHDSD